MLLAGTDPGALFRARARSGIRPLRFGARAGHGPRYAYRCVGSPQV